MRKKETWCYKITSKELQIVGRGSCKMEMSSACSGLWNEA